MPKIYVPADLAALQPNFVKLADAFHHASAQIAGPLMAAESAAKNADIASAVADFTSQWAAGLTKLGDAMTASSQTLGGSASAYSATDGHVSSSMGGK